MMSQFHPALTCHTQTPLNVAPTLATLRQHFITPNPLFFVRNHGNIPDVDVADYRFSIAGNVSQPLSFSLDELRGTFPHVVQVAMLSCAGNRRQELAAVRSLGDEVGGKPTRSAWPFGVGCA
jgi:sulfite oxidase